MGSALLYGWIHVSPDDLSGRMVGSMIGIDTYDLATQYFDGSIIPEPASLALLGLGILFVLMRRRD